MNTTDSERPDDVWLQSLNVPFETINGVQYYYWTLPVPIHVNANTDLYIGLDSWIYRPNNATGDDLRIDCLQIQNDVVSGFPTITRSNTVFNPPGGWQYFFYPRSFNVKYYKVVNFSSLNGGRKGLSKISLAFYVDNAWVTLGNFTTAVRFSLSGPVKADKSSLRPGHLKGEKRLKFIL